MKSIKGILSALLLACSAAAMGQQVDRLGLTEINISRINDASLAVSMTVRPGLCSMGRDQLMKVVPVLTSLDGQNRLELASYSIAGKNQYYYTIRSNGDQDPVYLAGSKVLDRYLVAVPWQDWMGECKVDLEVVTTTCCGNPVSEERLPLAELDFVPPVIPVASDLEYIEPIVKEVKEYVLEGRAYVNFPVNRTEIFPDYMNNPAELRKITSSIDTIRDNPDASIESITLTGYASPEGPYANNVRLAIGRTEAVRNYVSKLYPFDLSVYKTASVPEDWGGLREWIEKSTLPLRNSMLTFIDSDYPIEKRNDRFRELFPGDYPFLLANVYPWLRHTDYLIKYNIRHYSDVEEIRMMMATRPQNLSLDEIYLLAKTMEPGSDEYHEVFEVAVRLFPEDPLANLNAANLALLRGEMDAAERYLLKAGDSTDADYARGMFYAKKKDYDTAMHYLNKCNTPKAMNAIERVRNIINFSGTVNYSGQK